MLLCRAIFLYAANPRSAATRRRQGMVTVGQGARRSFSVASSSECGCSILVPPGAFQLHFLAFATRSWHAPQIVATHQSTSLRLSILDPSRVPRPAVPDVLQAGLAARCCVPFRLEWCAFRASTCYFYAAHRAYCLLILNFPLRRNYDRSRRVSLALGRDG